MILLAIAATAGLLAAGVAWLYLYQERMLFYPQRLSLQDAAVIKASYARAEELVIGATDGVRLHGWFIRGNKGHSPPLVIYFGGNAEEVSSLIPHADRFGGWSLALVNYRGYGMSGGKPGESELLHDALLVYDNIVKRPDVDPSMVVAMGRSLGTAVAISLASERPLAGLVLVSPFDSIRGMAREFYPWLPVSLVLKHPFDSISRAGSVKAPTLVMIASEDRIVRPERTMRLVYALGAQYRVRIIYGAGHNDIGGYPAYWTDITGFLGEIEGGMKDLGGKISQDPDRDP